MRTEQPANPAVRRLHPMSMLYFLAHSGKELAGLLPLIPVLVLLANRLFGREIDRFLLTAAVIAMAAVLLIVFAWIRWRRFQYRVEPGAIYMEDGLWTRRKIWIPKERILSLDTTVSVYNRLLGLVRLEVETAGGDGKPEAVLSSITKAEAARILAALGRSGSSPAPDPAAGGNDGPDRPNDSGTLRYRLTLGRTVLLSITSGKFAIVWSVVAGGGLKLWDQWLRDTPLWNDLIGRLSAVNTAGMSALYAAATLLLAGVATFLLEHGFRLEKADGKLTIERGLLETKRKVIAARRIQAVRVSEHALHKLLGMATVRIVVTGSSDEDKKTADLFPLVPVTELPALFAAFLPDFRLPETWNSVSRQAYGSYVTLPVLLCLLAATAGIVWLPTDWRWCGLLLPLVVWLGADLEFRQAAWSQEGGQLAVRFGSFSRQLALIPRSRVQWHRISQTPLQEGKQLATLKVVVASGNSGAGFALRHGPASGIGKLSNWLSGAGTPPQL